MTILKKQFPIHWRASLVVILWIAFDLSFATAAPPKDEREPLLSIEFLTKFYRSEQAWAKEKAASQLVRHGVNAIPVAAKLLATKDSVDVHHGLLMLQHLSVDPDTSIRLLAQGELKKLLMGRDENTTKRVSAILALQPIKNEGIPYPRGLPAGLGQPGIEIVAEYFGDEKKSGAFYTAKVTSKDGTVRVQFKTQGPTFADPSHSINITSKVDGGNTFVEVDGDVPAGSQIPSEKLVEKRISAKAISLKELRKHHRDEFDAYNRVFDAIKQGYITSRSDFVVLP